jgi:hypothetical protein
VVGAGGLALVDVERKNETDLRRYDLTRGGEEEASGGLTVVGRHPGHTS